jgi:hypothetical protein
MKKVIIKENKKEYYLDEPRDKQIYAKVKKLEKLNLKKEEKELVKLIKSQLEKNWRKSLLANLTKLTNKSRRIKINK